MKILSKDPLDTKIAAEKFIRKLRKKAQAVVIGLRGDLGAGKTTFVKFVAESLGIKNHITSPTFVIMKKFTIYDLRFKNLIHIDAYRLKESKELKNLGWDNIIKDPNNVIFLEWPEKVNDILPEDTIFVHLIAEGTEHNERIIKFI